MSRYAHRRSTVHSAPAAGKDAARPPACSPARSPARRLAPALTLALALILALFLAACSDDPAAPDPGPPPVESLEVTPQALLLEPGETQALEIRADGTLRTDLSADPPISVESSNEAVVRVTGGGTLEAVAPG
ncbi:MAG: hypothetical protein EA352_12430 [Gemmatimonadales bacterium]|nr:MAG: hypothetical protein EA352_12430 [Gemmatimonadales bacterium]